MLRLLFWICVWSQSSFREIEIFIWVSIILLEEPELTLAVLCFVWGGCFRATHRRQRHPEISNFAQKCKSCRLSAGKVGRIYFEKFGMFLVCSELAAVRSRHPFPPLWRQEQSSARHYWFRVRTNIESWISFQNHPHGSTFGRKEPWSVLSSFGIQYQRDNIKGPICPNYSKETHCHKLQPLQYFFESYLWSNVFPFHIQIFEYLARAAWA